MTLRTLWHHRPRLGLREKIALTVWLVTVIAVFVVGATAVLSMRRNLNDNHNTLVAARWVAMNQLLERKLTPRATAEAANGQGWEWVTLTGTFNQPPRLIHSTSITAENCTRTVGFPTTMQEVINGDMWYDCDDGTLLLQFRPMGATGYVAHGMWVRRPSTEQVDNLERTLWWGGGIASVLVALAAWLLAAVVARPVRRAGRIAARFGAGDLTARLPETGHDDVAQMSRQFNQMADHVVAMLEAQRHFTSDTAHELRTPTAALLASASALENPETRDEAAAIVAPQLRRLSQLTEDLLSLSRFDNDREQLRLQTTDLVGLVRATARGMKVTVRATRPQREVEVDPVRVQAIVRNLVTNAVRYGAEPVVVSLDFRREPVVLTVTDGGPGVPPEARATIFDRFVRADAARHGEGSGLGLAITRENARLHGGDVTLDDDGRTFRVVLGPEPGQPDARTNPTPATLARQDARLAHQTRWVLATFVLGVLMTVVVFVWDLPRRSGQAWAVAAAVMVGALMVWAMLAAVLHRLGRWWVRWIFVLTVSLGGAWLVELHTVWWPLLVAWAPLALLLLVDERLRQ